MKHASIILCHYGKIDDFGEKAAGTNPPRRSALVRKCLESLWETVDYPAEIIVMDNGGNPDDSSFFLDEVRKKRITALVRFADNMHFAYAWNKGARLATGDYLSFVCNDIVFRPTWLSTCVSLLERYPERKFLATPFITYDKKKHTIEILDGNRVNMRSGSNCMVIRRSDFDFLGDFPHHRIGGSLWFTKMFRAGYRSIAPPEDLAVDAGFRRGVNFVVPIEVKKTLLDGSFIHFEEKKQ